MILFNQNVNKKLTLFHVLDYKDQNCIVIIKRHLNNLKYVILGASFVSQMIYHENFVSQI